ncbi:hypothetical protein TorRG33x02_297010 [Trema orientale]|uniref:Uncharacterized protein n=1 Tax=Trema orientale TaxID=63057 RepID=A0A2P5C577_TREOI|nr:hypothetical protein TorRG33x02_297010 [Trema orientale]
MKKKKEKKLEKAKPRCESFQVPFQPFDQGPRQTRWARGIHAGVQARLKLKQLGPVKVSCSGFLPSCVIRCRKELL